MGAMEPIGARLPTGETVLREVGRGALARVYLVSDGRDVRVLKLLPRGLGRRVQHEFRMAHDLEHPNLGRVEARVDLGDRPGLLMPWVRGARLVARSPTPPDRRAYLAAFEQLLRALGRLHAMGRVHRDVKPENVLVDRLGRATLIDFDLALDLDAPHEAPKVAGTVAYLSPEQARGEPATPASDLYAAGVMLYAALTGEIPFHGSVDELLGAGRAPRAPAAPSSFHPDLAPFDALVGGLLAADPAERFVSADAASDALDRARTAERAADEGAS